MSNRNTANTSFTAPWFSICTGCQQIQCIVKSGKIFDSYVFYKDFGKNFSITDPQNPSILTSKM